MAGRVLLLAVAMATLLAVCAATPTDTRIRRHPPLDWMHRKVPPPQVKSRVGIQELWIEQVLDHFDSTNTATWNQRYYRNDAYYRIGGPAFVNIGGESELSDAWVAGGSLFDMAVEHGAVMFALEHRFYGASRPTPDKSVASLRYMNTTQALEDLATFIRQQRRDDPQLASAKWVVFGGSYAGDLAAWARLRYPDIIDGAVASSALVLAQVNFEENLEVVAKAIQTFDPECLTVVTEAMQELEELLQSDAGISTVSDLFGTCEPLDLSKEYVVAVLTSYAINKFTGLAMYNVVPNVGKSSLQLECEELRSIDANSQLERLTKYMNLGTGLYCIDPDWEAANKPFQDTQWNGDSTRQWLWQTCTELGYFQTTDSANQPFGIWTTVPYFTYRCTLLFGSEYSLERVEEGVRTTNLLYGGRTPNVTNVAFVNGALDPCSPLSVLEDLNEFAPAIVIPYLGHCADGNSASSTDTPGVAEAHVRIAQLVAQWVS